MTVQSSDIRAIAAKFLQYISTLHPDAPSVSVSDVEVPDREAIPALAYLYETGHVVGRVDRSNGNTVGLIAISDVRITRKGHAWLALLRAGA